MNKDNIIKNLNTISNIKQYQKFYHYNDLIYIEYNDYLQFARRWLYGRNRYDNLIFLRKVFQNSFNIIDNLMKEYFCTKKDKTFIIKNLNNFYDLYKKSVISLNQIKDTYINDTKISSEIYILINEINIKLNKLIDLNIIINK